MNLKPGNVWVIERALERDDDTEAALATCLLRGWVEHFEDLPTGRIENLSNPNRELYDSVESHFKLTEAGWTVINNSQAWVRFGALVAVLSLLAALI